MLGFWILDPLYIGLGTLLSWFYSVVPSFAVAIILLTIAVSVLRMPLVAKQVKSQQEMQKVQPELKRIQAKYKADPQKRNEELMKLYKEHNVNPFAGCLPMLLQMPIFIVLYRLINDLGRPEPKHIPTGSDLYSALRESGGEMRSFGIDLADAASRVSGFGNLLPYLVLIALVVGTGYFQQRQMTARLPKDAINPQMQIMTKIFPAFMGFFSFSIPAGVVLYFIVSNFWQIGQQAVMFRRRQAAEAAAGSGAGAGAKGGGSKGTASPPAKPAKASKPAKGGGFMARMAEAAAERQKEQARRAQQAADADDKTDRGAGGAGGGAGGRSGAKSGGNGKVDPAARKGGGGGGKAGGGKAGGGGQARGGGGGGQARGGGGGGKGGGGNGRVTPKGGGGRAQGKGSGSRSKSRNSRRGR